MEATLLPLVKSIYYLQSCHLSKSLQHEYAKPFKKTRGCSILRLKYSDGPVLTM